MTLTSNPMRAMVMTYSHAKVQGQRSVGSKDRVETNGQTDGDDCITSLANAVGNNPGYVAVVMANVDCRTVSC